MTFSDHVEEWRVLDVDHLLTQLFTKYWGNSMQEEEKAWHANNSEILTPAPSNNGWISNGKSGNDNDNNDDILPGCYVLNINNSSISTKHIWICMSNLLFKTSAHINKQNRLNTSGFLII